MITSRRSSKSACLIPPAAGEGSTIDGSGVNGRRGILALAIASVLVGGSLLPVHTHAAESGLMLEEIIVTAQKRSENLQDVPISVTAFSGQQMAELGVTNAIDLISQVPGLKVSGAGGGAINNFSIRGVTQNDFAAPRSRLSRSTSTRPTSASTASPTSASSISIASRCCAVRRVRCSAAMPRAVSCTT